MAPSLLDLFYLEVTMSLSSSASHLFQISCVYVAIVQSNYRDWRRLLLTPNMPLEQRSSAPIHIQSGKLPPSGAGVKNAWSYTSTLPHIFMAWCSDQHGDIFTRTFIRFRPRVILQVSELIGWLIDWSINRSTDWLVGLSNNGVRLSCLIRAHCTNS